VVKLEGELTMEDRAVFGFDIKTDFDWKEYLVIYVQVFQPIANWAPRAQPIINSQLKTNFV
jgi:hypothetical protein